MTEKYLTANGIELAYDEFGEPENPAILLIMGLGTQMIAWPESLCQSLAARGYRVIRFDNRDIGLSQKMENTRSPHLLKILLYSRFNIPLKVPYKLHDMADDAVGVLDALGLESVHIVGASMGGMIAQLIAAHHPLRVLSLTSIMSTSGDRSLPGPDREVKARMITRPASTMAEVIIEHSIGTYRLIASPGFPMSDDELHERFTRSYHRSYYPAGFKRQMAAIVASGDRVAELKKITAPTLVIHGKADRLVPVAGGVDTARHIPDAKLELIEGMGHDMPLPLVPKLVELIGDHIDRV